jgi:hypothetical protein
MLNKNFKISSKSTYYRGKDYEIRMISGVVQWKSMPEAVWNGTDYVDPSYYPAVGTDDGYDTGE